MKARIAMLMMGAAVIALVALSAPARVDGQQSDASDHAQHQAAAAQTTAGQGADMAQMMAAMRATDQKLDELSKKMNAATGPAKIDAMAELLTALVQDRRAMHASMASMPMMNMMRMGGMGNGSAAPAPK